METDKYPTRFKPGQVANPKGRPVSSRQRISEKLLADLADKWETHGAAVLEHLATNEPAKFAQIAYGLLPKDFGKSEYETAGSALLVEGRGNEPPLGSLQRIAEALLKDIARLWQRGETEHR
jgi:hypothetical protein